MTTKVQARIPIDGFVPLIDKQIPICDRQEIIAAATAAAAGEASSSSSVHLSSSSDLNSNVTNSPLHADFAFTRGMIDVSGWKSTLSSLPSNVWEDEEQEGNVKLTRPAHDAWGIKKIIFTFCDDFLQKVFDLPWSQQPMWRKLLLPVYEACGIKESQVVRSLLASMPPGISIPVHHDTGYWVKHTHRLHLAIESDSELVNFYVGATDDTLHKISFDEGRIVELNNQAKHAVDNKMTDRWRVHLIFDYVDDDDHPIKSRYLLQPGEKINQTRRSIDLARDAGSRPTPSFIIIGAQKCGTTSMYEYLMQHPLAIRGKRRETHYFDWRWNHSLPSSDEEQHRKYYMNFFECGTLHKHPSLVTGESTPSYLLHGDVVIPRFKMVCPWARVIVMLRNPVDRAYSQYQMCIDTKGTPEQLKVRGLGSYGNKSFEQVIAAEIEELNSLDIRPDSSFDHFQRVFLSSRPMTHGGHSIVARGLYALQLQPWLEAFPLDGDQIMIMSIADIQGSRATVQASMDKVFSFVGIPPHDLDDIDAKNSRTYSGMSDEARATLTAFYEPFNKRLSQLLNRDLSW